MAELREGLTQRKREREAQQGRLESWFNQSPWLATLVSTLIGPVTMLLLTLIFRLCILNKLVSFVTSRLEKVNILLVDR
ncbi:ENV1 protein, partial [Sitta europaea]|nr:ENV1 protein [Sitta europaea]